MSSLYSTRWHRVADLQPRLSPQLRVTRQHFRGERWMLLDNPARHRSLRLNSAAYAVAGRLDGRRSLQQLFEWQLAQPGDPATQDEIIDMLAQLREAELVQIDRTADFEQLLPHLERTSSARRRGNLLAWRMPLVDPSAFLNRCNGLARGLFSCAGMVVWSLAMVCFVVLLAQHAPTLWAHGLQWLATPRFALLAALLYLPIKLIHELSHGLAVRRWGGRVHEAGVTWMLGLPVPYVDASAASAFVQRYQRVAVGAAGLMAELMLAAIALPLWLWLEPGLARDLAFVTLAIAGVSTLVFNANPLQRLDGYYIATDLLELPNLATRSRAWWRAALQRRLLRLPGAEAMPVARGERPFLVAYAPLSWLVGVGIATIAVVWLGHVSLALGLAGGAVLGWQLVIRPGFQLVSQLRSVALARDGTARRWRHLVIAGGGLLVLVLCVPLPQRLLVQGIVWPGDQAQLRSDEDGFIAALLAADGQGVDAGALVLQLSSPRLAADLERQRARVDALETELFNALPGDGTAAGNTGAELRKAQAELERLIERTAGLEVRAHKAGRIVLPNAADLPGRFVRKGQLLGQVLDGEPEVVRVAVPERDASGLQRGVRAASVRLASAGPASRPARLERDGGGATLKLPSAALSERHGGDVQTDPRDADDRTPLQPVVLLDLLLDAAPTASDGARGRIGERAWVRLDLGYSPLLVQAAAWSRDRFLRHFNPQF